MKDVIKIVQAQSHEIRHFSAKHWLIFNQDQGWDFPPDEYSYFVAYIRDDIVGYTKSKIRGGILELESLLVQKELRRKGIGALLLRRVEKFAREIGCRKVILKTSEDHKEALKFYRKNGYKPYAVLKGCYFGLNWHFFAKEL